MKKWIVILAALMLLTAMAIPAFAANTEVAIVASGDMVYAGDEITITVSISTDVPYTSVIVDDLFDDELFELVSAEKANAPAIFADYSDDAYVATFENGNTYSGLLLTVKLKVKENVPSVTTTIGGNDIAVKNVDDTVSVTSKSAQVTIGCRHSYVSWDKTEDSHTGTCTLCGEPKTEAHDWADETTDVTPATCTNPGSETRHCLICGATKTAEIKAKGHAWDNDCDTDCNNGCGTTRDAKHKHADKWAYDEDKHWIACTVCGEKTDEVSHIPGPAATEKDNQVCLECGYILREAQGHIHDFDTIWQQDSINHWHVCKKPGCYTHGSSAAHDYDNECDVTCNTCGHIRNNAPHVYGTEWKGNASGHWYVCIICGAQSAVIPHVPGEAATMDTPQICTECGYWVKYPLSHEHTFGDKWQIDEVNHWKACTECGEHEELIPHNWDEGTVITEPTETMQGSMRYVCKDCGTAQIASIPVLGTPPTDQTDPTEQTEPTEPIDEPDPLETRPVATPPANNGGFPWGILVAVAALLLLTGIVLFVVEFIRSRKHNMHGKFSK